MSHGYNGYLVGEVINIKAEQRKRDVKGTSVPQ